MFCIVNRCNIIRASWYTNERRLSCKKYGHKKILSEWHYFFGSTPFPYVTFCNFFFVNSLPLSSWVTYFLNASLKKFNRSNVKQLQNSKLFLRDASSWQILKEKIEVKRAVSKGYHYFIIIKPLFIYIIKQIHKRFTGRENIAVIGDISWHYS